MNLATKKWIFTKASSVILLPLMLWFILSFVSIYDQGYLEILNFFLNSFFGKFVVLGIVWSFSFQVLSEVRHLIMDMGYGFELQTTRITGLLVIFGSFLLMVVIYLIGRNFF